MSTPQFNDLSDRELDILKLVATGASNKEIAQKLFISSNTVKVHLRNIFTKINAASRTEAAMYAVRIGLVERQPILGENETSDISRGDAYSSVHGSVLSGLEIQGSSAARKFPRWAALLVAFISLSLVYMGWRLSPGFAIFSAPTATALPPQNTATPIPHWRELSPAPIARSRSALVAYGNQIYSIAGLRDEGVVNGVNLFDPLTNTWTALPPKPTSVYDASAAVINGLIYVPGGLTKLGDTRPTKILEIYDTSTKEWKTGADLPIPLSAYGMVAFEGQLFVFGGWDGKTYHNDVFSYDPVTDSWSDRTPMPTARGFPGAAEAGGKIYVIGGINEKDSLIANEIYTPSHDHAGSDPWESGFPLPESRSKIQAATIADTIYIFGGEEAQGNRIGLIYFPQTDTWQSLEASPDPLGENFGMASIGTNLFFVGGNFGETYSAQNVTYQAIITLSIPIIIK